MPVTTVIALIRGSSSNTFRIKRTTVRFIVGIALVLIVVVFVPGASRKPHNRPGQAQLLDFSMTRPNDPDGFGSYWGTM